MSQFVVGPEAGDEDNRPGDHLDIQADERTRVRVRALPRLTLQASRLIVRMLFER